MDNTEKTTEIFCMDCKKSILIRPYRIKVEGNRCNMCSKQTSGFKNKVKHTWFEKGKPSPKKGIKTGKSTWNKGISCSKETKQKLSIALKGKSAWNKGKKLQGISCNKGKIMSEETKQKIREKRKLQIITQETKNKISIATKNQSAETKIKRVESIIKHWKSHKQTNIEIAAKKLFDKHNIFFKEQYRIKTKVFDFYLPSFNILIEMDGIYWHAKNKLTKDLSGLLLKNRLNDLYKDKLALDNGYTLIRIWEDEVNKLEEYIITILKPLIKNVS